MGWVMMSERELNRIEVLSQVSDGSESTFSYFAALERYLTAHGRPVAFYSDKYTGVSGREERRQRRRGDDAVRAGIVGTKRRDFLR